MKYNSSKRNTNPNVNLEVGEHTKLQALDFM